MPVSPKAARSPSVVSKASTSSRYHDGFHVDTTRPPSPVHAAHVARTTIRGSFARSPRPSFMNLPLSSSSSSSSSSKRAALAVPEITEEEYFRLLKKTDVLGHLLRVNDDLLDTEGQLEVAEVDNTKLDAMNKHIVVELEVFKDKYYESQRLFLSHVEQLTTICLHEEASGLGHTQAAAEQFANQFAHVRTLEDVHQATATAKLATTDDIQSQALAAVASARIHQLQAVCQTYRSELNRVENDAAQLRCKGNDVQVTEVQYAEKVEGTLKAVEAEKDKVIDEMHMTAKQNAALHDEIARLKQKLDDQKRYERECKRVLTQQEHAIQLLLQNVKTDIKKRYGFVPPALEEYALQTATPPPAPPSFRC
ncbi:Aste57867_3221 [Aphanomyces stellatus]|uniref:Aste57867_3221 protein n=1 Tax=Aphanomyces stellatus TaxID=120398 RepID=A0A485K987_9STRA|nr:hypothetical protein As57867_003211 [Aphanomyces stellatus]VFT80395.1 Aste57867_3221 [Aphanomyces stellatus]